MASSTIRLIYFNVKGRGEVSRLLLALAGKTFEDVRISKDEWLQMKPNSPCGTVPILEVDGKQFGQSRAIATYLAREFDLYGSKTLDGLKIDQAGQIAEDFVLEYAKKFFYVLDKQQREEGEKYLKEEAAPRFLGYFEKAIKEEGTGFVAGEKLTLGDVIIFDVCTGFLKPLVKDSLDDFSLVKAVVHKVGDNDRIKNYLLNQSPTQ